MGTHVGSAFSILRAKEDSLDSAHTRTLAQQTYSNVWSPVLLGFKKLSCAINAKHRRFELAEPISQTKPMETQCFSNAYYFRKVIRSGETWPLRERTRGSCSARRSTAPSPTPSQPCPFSEDIGSLEQFGNLKAGGAEGTGFQRSLAYGIRAARRLPIVSQPIPAMLDVRSEDLIRDPGSFKLKIRYWPYSVRD